MTRKLQRFQKTIFGTIAISMIATSMIGFGVGVGSRKANRYALRVNEEEVSFDDFTRARRSLEERFRSQFGDDYEGLLKSFNINIGQRVADELIVGLLLTQLGERLGMSVSDVEVTSEAMTILDGRVSDYESFLDRIGMTAPEFEAKVRQDILRRKVSSLFSTVALPADEEIRARARRELESFTIEVATVDPKSLVSAVAEPSAEQLSSFYEANKPAFEEGERVSYEYAVIEGKRVEGAISVDPREVEDFYQTRQSRYQLPDSARVSVIRFAYSKGADESAKKGVVEQAEAVLTELKGGAQFAELAKKHSSDEKTRDEGGNLGWVVAGTLGKEFDAAIFRDEPDFEPQLVKSVRGVDIVRVNDFKQGGVRPLDEVRSDIEAELRKEEVPGYLAHESHSLFDAWTGAATTLRDFAAEKSLVVANTEGLVAVGDDPVADLKGLSSQVLQRAADSRQLIELGDRFVLVELKDQRPRAVPPLEEIRNRVVAAYREKEAEQKAQQRANELTEKVRTGSASLSSFAGEFLVPVKVEKSITRSSGGDGVFRDSALREQLLRSASVGSVLPAPYRSERGWLVARVSSVGEPTTEELDKKISSVGRELASHEGQVVLSSVLNTVKAAAQTDIDASILAGTAG